MLTLLVSLKELQLPIVLKNPFPSQQIQMVSQDQPSASGSSYVLMCQGNIEQVFMTT
jgi:hypothetical protein